MRQGPAWISYRVWKAISDKSGITERRLPIVELEKVPLKSIATIDDWNSPEHFFGYEANGNSRGHALPKPSFNGLNLSDSFKASLLNLDKRFQTTVGSFWESRSEALLAGNFQYFSDRHFPMGIPPNWFENPYEKLEGPKEEHFSKINEFGYGDVKAIWELSRFSFVFELVRIYARTGNEELPNLFWHLVDDWIINNPVNSGTNWKCGQEVSLRVFAIVFGAWAFAGSSATTPNRLSNLSRLMHFSGRRIEKYVRYAVTQKNNHAISEGAGLWTIGLLFPELKHAETWRNLGKQILEQQLERLYYEDGGFVQHSANYHRSGLQTVTWSISLGRRMGFEFPENSLNVYRRATKHMTQWIEPRNGRVPRFGNDDGSLIWPLSVCQYDDFRAAAQSANALAFGELPFEPGPWDEEVMWLCDQASAKLDRSSPEKVLGPISISAGSCSSIIRDQNSKLFLRCGEFQHRPAHLDSMHVDLWFDGLNVALDPGTYSYNAKGPWSEIPLALGRNHNTVLVNDEEIAGRVGRFLFEPWPKATIVESRSLSLGNHHSGHLLQAHQQISFGQDHEVFHRRSVAWLGNDRWAIIDHLVGLKPSVYRLHWLLDSSFQPAELTITEANQNQSSDTQVWGTFHGDEAYCVSVGCNHVMNTSLVEGDEGSDRGWYAPRYLKLAPAKSLAVTVRASETTFATYFSRHAAQFHFNDQDEENRLSIQSEDGHFIMSMSRDSDESLINDIHFQDPNQASGNC